MIRSDLGTSKTFISSLLLLQLWVDLSHDKLELEKLEISLWKSEAKRKKRGRGVNRRQKDWSWAFLVSFSCTTEYLSSRFSSKLLIQNFDLPSIPLRTVATLRKHGITTSCVGRKLKASDFDQFDYIFGMDDSNVSNIKRAQPAGSKAQVKLFSFWWVEARE